MKTQRNFEDAAVIDKGEVLGTVIGLSIEVLERITRRNSNQDTTRGSRLLMSLEEAVHILGQFWTNALRGRDLLHSCFAEPINGTESTQEQILAVLTYAWTIIEDAFTNAFLHQQLVVSVGEAMGFVSNPLQQTQRARVRREHKRQRASRAVDLFILFRETDDRQVVQPEALQFAAGRRKLPFAAIDDDQVWQTNCEESVIPSGVEGPR